MILKIGFKKTAYYQYEYDLQFKSIFYVLQYYKTYGTYELTKGTTPYTSEIKKTIYFGGNLSGLIELLNNLFKSKLRRDKIEIILQ